MIVAVVAPLLVAVAVIFLAPQLVSQGAWRIARPRLALRVWLCAFAAGAVAMLISLVAALGEILFSFSGSSGASSHGWVAPIAVTLFGWIGLGSVGALAALTLARYEPLSAAERRAAMHLVLAAAGSTYRREMLRGVDVSFVDATRPAAMATRATGRQIVVSRGLEQLLDAAELRSVLEHERAHLTEGHDRLVRLTRLNLACFPALRGARSFERDVRLLIELAADDIAAHRCGVPASAGALEALATATADESVALRAARLRRGSAWSPRGARRPAAAAGPAARPVDA